MSDTTVRSAQPTSAASKRFSATRALLLASPFMLMGGVAVVLALYGLLTRQLDVRAGKHLLTIIVVCAGLAMCIIGWFASKRPRPSVLLKAIHPNEPWMWREDWVAGRVDNSVHRSIFFLWISVGVFDLVCLLALVLVLPGMRYGHQAAWLALLFPLTAAAVTMFAARTTRTWRLFGRASLALTVCPVAPGNLLQGEIRVATRLQPEHAYYLRMSCIRRTTALRDKTRVTTERILWQIEKWYEPNLPQAEAGATRLPVFFVLPSELPDTSGESGDGIQWRLEVHAKVSGPDFHGTFEIPVFKSAASDDAPPASDRKDPSDTYQLTLDEIRQKICSRIVVAEIPGGLEFSFPASRNPGFAAGATLFWLIWTSAILLMLLWHAPPVFPLVFAALDLIMGIFMLDLWLRRSRVLATPERVVLQTSWLAYRKEVVIPAADIGSLKADIGATAGHVAYYDLKLKTRAGREFVLAKNLSHKPEADWLLREMVAVLKRDSGPVAR